MKAAALLLVCAALGACGERAAPSGNMTDAPASEPRAAPTIATTPVRIGEGGPAFVACQASGTPRGGGLPVRAAPFDGAATGDRLPPGARFFVCTRSIDQRWLGIVFAPDGTLSPACGVSEPVPARRNYSGPCKSGWVESAAVRLTAV